MTYIFVFFFLYIVIGCFKYTKTNTMFIFYWFISLYLIIFSCIRPEYAAIDIRNYYPAFKFINESFEQVIKYGFNNWEKGYVLFNKIVGSLFGLDIFVFLSLTSIIIILPFELYIWRKSKNPFFTMAFFIASGGYMTLLSALRQMISYAILLKSYDYLSEKKTLAFFIFLLLAFSFHRSALIIFVFFIVSLLYNNREITYKTLLWFVLLSIIIYFSFNNIFNFINQFARSPHEAHAKGGIVHCIFLWTLSIFCYYFDKKDINENKEKKLFFLMLLFSALIQTMVIRASALGRLNKYFNIAFCILLPDSLNRCIKRKPFLFSIFAKLLVFFLTTILCFWSFQAYYKYYYGNVFEIW